MVAVADVDAARRQWRKLLDSPQSESDGAFTFGPGPRIRLVRADSPGIQRIVVQVRSVERVRAFLAGRRLPQPETGGNISIAQAATGGLHVVLVDD